MKVLVTGSTGLLGANVVRALLEMNYQITVIIRKTSNLSVLDGLPLNIIYGNINNEDDITNAVEGCNAIIHIAADTNQTYTKLSQYEEINVKPVKYIIAAARLHRVAKVIYVSSAAVCGYGTKDFPGTETEPMRPPFSKSFYIQSKAIGQRLIQDASQDTNCDFIVVNPSFMLGAYDSKPSSGKIILMSYKKRFIFVPPGGKNFVHVKDVADGICNALQHGKNGECYLLTGKNLSYMEFFKIVEGISNQKSTYIIIPPLVLKITGWIFDVLSSVGLRSSLSLINAKILCAGNYYSNQKSVKELNMQLTPISIAVKDATQWFIKEGYLN